MTTLAQLVETMTRPGLMGLAGRAVEKRCQRDLTSYFRALKAEVQQLNMGEIAETGVTEEIGRHMAMMRVTRTVNMHQDILQGILATNMLTCWLISQKIHHFAEATQGLPDTLLGTDFIPSDLTGNEVIPATEEFAAAWAEVNAAKSVVGISQTTIKLIADAVATGIREELGINGTAALIMDTMDGMTIDRARMIAQTEMNAAFSAASLDKLERLGIQYKRWITSPGNVCPICEDNEAESPIPFEQSFSSGDDGPPAHPWCRCAVTGARPPASTQ